VALKEIIFIINADQMIVRKYIGVPFLSKHKLWIDYRKEPELSSAIEAILYNLNNKNSIFDLAVGCGVDFWVVNDFIIKLQKAGLVELQSISDTWFSKENPFEKIASRSN